MTPASPAPGRMEPNSLNIEQAADADQARPAPDRGDRFQFPGMEVVRVKQPENRASLPKRTQSEARNDIERIDRQRFSKKLIAAC